MYTTDVASRGEFLKLMTSCPVFCACTNDLAGDQWKSTSSRTARFNLNMGIQGLSKVIGDNAPGAVKENEIKNYFGLFDSQKITLYCT